MLPWDVYAVLPLPFKPDGLEKTPAHPLQVARSSRCESVTDFQPESCAKWLGQSQPEASVSLSVKPADNSRKRSGLLIEQLNGWARTRGSEAHPCDLGRRPEARPEIRRGVPNSALSAHSALPPRGPPRPAEVGPGLAQRGVAGPRARGGGHGLGGGIQGPQGRLPLRLLRVQGGQDVVW